MWKFFFFLLLLVVVGGIYYVSESNLTIRPDAIEDANEGFENGNKISFIWKEKLPQDVFEGDYVSARFKNSGYNFSSRCIMKKIPAGSKITIDGAYKTVLQTEYFCTIASWPIMLADLKNNEEFFNAKNYTLTTRTPINRFVENLYKRLLKL